MSIDKERKALKKLHKTLDQIIEKHGLALLVNLVGFRCLTRAFQMTDSDRAMKINNIARQMTDLSDLIHTAN